MFGLGIVEIAGIVAVVALTGLWFWSLVDCAVRTHAKDMDKLVWVLLIVSTYFFGSLAYLMIWRSRTRPTSAA